MKKQRYFFNVIEDDESETYAIALVHEKAFNDGDFGIGFEDSEPIAVFLYEHDLRQEEENMFGNVDGLTAEDFKALFEGTEFEVVELLGLGHTIFGV